MKRSSLLLAVCLLLAGVGACTKAALKTTYDKQITNIESFIDAQIKKDTATTITRNGGSYRVTLHDTLDVREPRTDSLRPGGKVSLYYACFTLTSSNLTTANLVATNVESIAKQAGWKLTDTTRYKLDTLTLNEQLLPGLRLGLEGVQPADEGYILFTGEYGFGNTERGTIPARSALVYAIWIEDIDND